MKKHVRLAMRIYKWLLLLFTAAYWVYIIVDDYPLLKISGVGQWPRKLLVWAVYYALYAFGYSLFYWAAAAFVIMVAAAFRKG